MQYILLFILTVFLSSANAQEDALRYVNTYSPPNHYHDRPGEIDFLFLQIERDIGLKIKSEIVPAARMLRMLEKGDFDVTALQTPSKNHFKFLYCEGPITKINLVFFSNDPAVQSIKQLPKAATIYATKSLFESLDQKFKEHQFNTNLDAGQIPLMFARQHIHYVVDLNFRLQQGLKDIGYNGNFSSDNLQIQEFSFCVNSKMKNGPEVLKKINTYIKEKMKEKIK